MCRNYRKSHSAFEPAHADDSWRPAVRDTRFGTRACARATTNSRVVNVRNLFAGATTRQQWVILALAVTMISPTNQLAFASAAELTLLDGTRTPCCRDAV